MNWYGKEHLNPAYTKKLMKKWQAPPGNTAASYYELFPELYPYHLPDDHYIVKYDETLFPKNRDYRGFKKAPPEIKSNHRIEWEDGYGPCNVCEECISAKKRNDEQMEKYYADLKEWRETGKPMHRYM
jgi:hypothetical protein